ncbi:MAG: AAA family ATPase, partial [Planctomycetes bacterium]|nr:AAA family ATPase [Planctomycetota bacterium]
MLLRKLELVGFKSFADKTEFVFDPGITGVVGPNGCGKSNVVDAIKWALGEMSAKSLRGGELMDVIFNGAETRPPLGFAEVSLTFSNEDGRLPIEYAEVTISRRLFRSGESEYLLNRQICRLRDIRELFMDTGIGADSYSIIEQGKINAMLESSPRERREVIEEAAGISKYKAKKRETQNKLERVTQDLVLVNERLKDLLSSVRSLKIQAGKAERYQIANREYREKRTQLSLHIYREMTAQGAERVEQLAAIRARQGEAEAAAAELEAGLSEAEAGIAARDEDLRRAQEVLRAAESQVERLRERIAGDEKYLAELTESGASRRSELAELNERLAEARRQRAETAEALTALAGEIERATRELEERTGTLAEMTRGAADLAERLNRKKSESLEVLRKRSAYQNDVHSAESERRRLEAQRAKIEHRDGEIAGELALVEEQERTAGAARAALDAEKLQATAEFHTNDAALTELKARLSALSAEVAALRQQESRMASRLEVLQENERRHEGLGAGVRAVLDALADPASGLGGEGGVAGVRGIVADVVTIDSENVPVVDAILNGRAQSILAATRADAVRILDFVRARKLGRVHVLPLDTVAEAVGAAAGVTGAAATAGAAPAGAELCDGAEEEPREGGAARPTETASGNTPREQPADPARPETTTSAVPGEQAHAPAGATAHATATGMADGTAGSAAEGTTPAPVVPAGTQGAAAEEPPVLGHIPDLDPGAGSTAPLEKALFGGVPLSHLTSLGTSPGLGGFGFLAGLFGNDALRATAPAGTAPAESAAAPELGSARQVAGAAVEASRGPAEVAPPGEPAAA